MQSLEYIGPVLGTGDKALGDSLTSAQKGWIVLQPNFSHLFASSELLGNPQFYFVTWGKLSLQCYPQCLHGNWYTALKKRNH